MYTTTGTCEYSSFFERGAFSGSGFFFKESAGYSPYGTLLHHRHGTQTGSDSYRYAFQGQEKDDEIKGEGNSYNYEYRMHDPRIGRFFARNPLESKYAFYSPYQFSGNRLIDCAELEGIEPEAKTLPEESSAPDSTSTIHSGGSVAVFAEQGFTAITVTGMVSEEVDISQIERDQIKAELQRAYEKQSKENGITYIDMGALRRIIKESIIFLL